jgi:hypothetical protein
MRLGRRQVWGFLVACVFLVPGLWTGCGFKSAGSGPPSTSGSGGTDVVGSGGQAGSNATGGHIGTGGTVAIGTGGLGATGSGGDVAIAVDAARPNCGQTSVSVMPVPPDILIVQDKSLSMSMDSGGATCTAAGCSKWSQVSAAMDTVVMATQGSVNWGLIFFGSDTMCGVNTTPSVPIAGNNYTPISQAYVNNQPSSYTPTEAAVNAATAYMNTVPDQNPKYLLLATDGLPNCKAGDRTVTDDDSPGATTAVTNAAAAGFPTFVVGIGNTMGDATLNMFATAGGVPKTGSADGNLFYEVNSTSDLVAALTKIVGQATSCSFPLTGVSGDLEKVAVSAKDASGNTIEIMQDATNGWSYTDATKTAIILNGDACKNLKSVTYTGFQFIYTCSTGIITIS